MLSPWLANRTGYAGYRLGLGSGYAWHVRFRDLVSELGVWNRRDPIGYADGRNLYQYAGSRPVWGIDPMGLRQGGPCNQASGMCGGSNGPGMLGIGRQPESIPMIIPFPKKMIMTPYCKKLKSTLSILYNDATKKCSMANRRYRSNYETAVDNLNNLKYDTDGLQDLELSPVEQLRQEIIDNLVASGVSARDAAAFAMWVLDVAIEIAENASSIESIRSAVRQVGYFTAVATLPVELTASLYDLQTALDGGDPFEIALAGTASASTYGLGVGGIIYGGAALAGGKASLALLPGGLAGAAVFGVGGIVVEAAVIAANVQDAYNRSPQAHRDRNCVSASSTLAATVQKFEVNCTNPQRYWKPK